MLRTPSRYAFLKAAVITAALLAGSVAVYAKPAPHTAQTLHCVPERAALESLKQQYGEAVAWMGRSETGTTIMLTTNTKTHTWTLMLVTSGARPDQIVACPLFGGGVSFMPSAGDGV